MPDHYRVRQMTKGQGETKTSAEYVYASLHYVACAARVCESCVHSMVLRGALLFLMKNSTQNTTCTSVAPSMRDVLVTIICLNYRWWITVHLQWKIRFLLVFLRSPHFRCQSISTMSFLLSVVCVIPVGNRIESSVLSLSNTVAGFPTTAVGNRHKFMAEHEILVTCTGMDSLLAFFVLHSSTPIRPLGYVHATSFSI